MTKKIILLLLELLILGQPLFTSHLYFLHQPYIFPSPAIYIFFTVINISSTNHIYFLFPWLVSSPALYISFTSHIYFLHPPVILHPSIVLLQPVIRFLIFYNWWQYLKYYFLLIRQQDISVGEDTSQGENITNARSPIPHSAPGFRYYATRIPFPG